MQLDKPLATEQLSANRHRSGGLHDVHFQCLRILRCTAKAMSSSPGGLRFQAGTRPWLDGLLAVPAAGVKNANFLVLIKD